MGEAAEDAILSEDEYFDYGQVHGVNPLEEEPIPTAYDIAEYQLATVFYDFGVHPEAQEQILGILKFYGDNVVKELF